jgi:hypothetical protein
MKEEYFFDKPENVKKFLKGFYACLGVLIVRDLILTLLHLKHPFFSWDGYPFFNGAFGFVSYVSIVLVSSNILRKLVKRKEDYYD